MGLARYDHRKMAFRRKQPLKNNNQENKRNSLIKKSSSKTQRKSVDVYGGYLGNGRVNAKDANVFVKNEKNLQKISTRRRGGRKDTVHPTGELHSGSEQQYANNISAGLMKKRRPEDDVIEKFDSPLQRAFFDDGTSTEGSVAAIDSEEHLTSFDYTMCNLEEKQQKREQERMGEKFEEIKGRMADIFDEYGVIEDIDDEEFDMRTLTDPDAFNKEDSETVILRSEINKWIEGLTVGCQDKEELLSNILESSDEMQDEISDINITNTDDIKDMIFEYKVAVQMSNNRTCKLQTLFNKLLNLCISQSISQEKRKHEITNLQRKVVGKFKKLHDIKSERKEKIDTWKYAANEIVDLLQSVRKEGTADFEKLVAEFEKLLDALKLQTEMVTDLQDSVEKQQQTLQESDEMTENFKKENQILQEDYDRCKVKLTTVEMKCSRLETRLKEVQDGKKKGKKGKEESNEKKTSLVNSTVITSTTLEETEMLAKIEKLQNQVKKGEEELKQEKKKSRELQSQCVDDAQVSPLNNETEETISNDEETEVQEEVNQEKNCMTCESFKNEVISLTEKNEKFQNEIITLKQQLSEKLREKETVNEEEEKEMVRRPEVIDDAIDGILSKNSEIVGDNKNDILMRTSEEQLADAADAVASISNTSLRHSGKVNVKDKSIQVQELNVDVVCKKCNSPKIPLQSKTNEELEKKPSSVSPTDISSIIRKIFSLVRIGGRLSKGIKNAIHRDMDVVMPVVPTLNQQVESGNFETVATHLDSQQEIVPPNQQDEEGLERSWTESGFFDNTTTSMDDKKESDQDKSAWNLIKKGKSGHVIRFLSSIGHNKCSYLKERLELMGGSEMSEEETVMAELNAFAEHAVELLGVISFAVDRLMDVGINNDAVGDTMVANTKPSWQPFFSPVNESPDNKEKEKFLENTKQQTSKLNEPDMPHKLIFFSGSPVPPQTDPQQHTRAISAAKEHVGTERKKQVSVAEKKRQKILERHKKLVERLRASGSGLKQIYAILGIKNGPSDDEIEEDSRRHTESNAPPVRHQWQTKETVSGAPLFDDAYQQRKSIRPINQQPMMMTQHMSTNHQMLTNASMHNFRQDGTKHHLPKVGLNIKPPQLRIDNRRSADLQSHRARSVNRRHKTLLPPINRKKMTTQIPMRSFLETKSFTSYKF